MKNIFKILTINLLFLFLLSFTVFSINEVICGSGIVPNKPHVFHGMALRGGSAVASQTVTATLDGNSFSTTTSSGGSYVIDVSRCSDSSVTSVSFTVCTRSASPSGTFGDGGDTEQNLTITSACPAAEPGDGVGGGGGGGGAGGGGAGGAAPSAETDLDLKTEFTTIGVTLKQTQGDTVTFTLGGVEYTVEVTKLRDDSVTLTVGDQSKSLNIGDTVFFDVNGDGVDDISVTLKGIDGGRAELVYKKLDSGMLALLDMIRSFYAGTSPYTMMGILDKIRAFYGG